MDENNELIVAVAKNIGIPSKYWPMIISEKVKTRENMWSS